MASPRSKSLSSSSDERTPSGEHSPSRSVGTHHQSPQLQLGAGPSTQSPPVLTPSPRKLVSSSPSAAPPATSGVHSMTTTPTKAVQSFLVASGRGSGGSGSGDSGGISRKRGRGGNDGSSGSGGDKRGKGELDAPKETDPNCGICGKRFRSWKAYFGHLRAHPEREWRGAFPPPTAGTGSVPMDPNSRRLLELNLAPTLLGIAVEIQGVNTVTRADTNIASPGPRRVLFDLNRSPPPEDDEEEEEEQEGRGR